MPNITLSWIDTNNLPGVAGDVNEDGVKVYRSTSLLDSSNNGASMPAPLASLASDSVTYVDASVVLGTIYYYIISNVKGAIEKYSDNIIVSADDYVGVKQTVNISSVDYIIHRFFKSGNFQLSAVRDVEYLLIAGGGSTAPQDSLSIATGGGAGGGYKTGTIVGMPIGASPITVGEGGDTVGLVTSNGGDSVFDAISAIGGGGGGDNSGVIGELAGKVGANGGGASVSNALVGAAGIGSDGFDGSNGGGSAVTPYKRRGGGGGGAGGDGGAIGVWFAGDGGIGVQSSITGTAEYYGGGGGGSRGEYSSGSIGGLGGGGGIALSQDGIDGIDGLGGGAGAGNNAASGGDGVVILKYLP